MAATRRKGRGKNSSEVFGTRKRPRRSRTLVQLAELVESTRKFDLWWSPAEQRLVDHLREQPPHRKQILKSVKVSSTRLSQLIRQISNRLDPLMKAIESGSLDQQDVRTWPIVLLKLDEGRRRGLHLEMRLLGRRITMVAQLLGCESPLARSEFRKGVGRGILARLEQKLKPHGLLDELAWKMPVRDDSRRAWQHEIERANS